MNIGSANRPILASFRFGKRAGAGAHRRLWARARPASPSAAPPRRNCPEIAGCA